MPERSDPPGNPASDGQRAAAALLRASRSTVVLTGAGISVPSGIPDFRSPGTGIWEGVDPMRVAHIDAWRTDPVTFWRFYGHRFQILGPARPNAAHRAVAGLQRRGLVDAVITQNIDRLHQAGGAEDVVEMHGSIASSICLRCGERAALEEVEKRIAVSADGVPRCLDCGAPLKPGVVLFGEMLPEQALERAFDACSAADLIIAIGSSLEVHPVAGLPDVVLGGGGRLILVTQGPTPYDDRADVRLGGDVVAELLGIVDALDAPPQQLTYEWGR